jgi:hypothetical protein
MAGAQNLQMGLLLDEFADLIERSGGSQVIGTVFEIAGPVLQSLACGGSKERRKSGGCHHGRKKLEEGSFVHV